MRTSPRIAPVRGRSAVRRRAPAAVWVFLLWSAAAGRVLSLTPGAPSGPLDRAATLIEERAFDGAADLLRGVLAADPSNRQAKELLAYALESSGDRDGERRVRSDLAAEFPADARLQADYGRVLERSGDNAAALAAYRRARSLDPERPDPDLDASIDRLRGRTAIEAETPVARQSDPDASATRLQIGAAMPFGASHHVAVFASHADADSRTTDAVTSSDTLAANLVLRNAAGADLMIGPRLHAVTPPGDAPKDLALGGAVAGHAPLGSRFVAEAGGAFRTPWDEAAVAVLHGGRTSFAQGRLYARFLRGRVLLEAGARRRSLSILTGTPSDDRATADQSSFDAGADFLVWTRPGRAVRGEMFDDGLTAPATLASSLTLAYRHYDVTTRTAPEFQSIIGLTPRAVVDEGSFNAMLASPRGRLGVGLRAGLGRDSARDARLWRAGGGLVWAPASSVRLSIDYEEASDASIGFVGRRSASGASLHVDF